MTPIYYKKCQSCYMPIKKDHNKGTEADKSLSPMYCYHCYENGKFTDPNLTLNEMQTQTLKLMQEKMPISSKLFGKTYTKKLAKLARWNKQQLNI